MSIDNKKVLCGTFLEIFLLFSETSFPNVKFLSQCITMQIKHVHYYDLQKFKIHFDAFATRDSKDYLIINDDSGMGKLKYFGNSVPPDYDIRSKFFFVILMVLYCGR